MLACSYAFGGLRFGRELDKGVVAREGSEVVAVVPRVGGLTGAGRENEKEREEGREGEREGKREGEREGGREAGRQGRQERGQESRKESGERKGRDGESEGEHARCRVDSTPSQGKREHSHGLPPKRECESARERERARERAREREREREVHSHAHGRHLLVKPIFEALDRRLLTIESVGLEIVAHLAEAFFFPLAPDPSLPAGTMKHDQ